MIGTGMATVRFVVGVLVGTLSPGASIASVFRNETARHEAAAE
jgi:hypothetical protein